MSPAERKQRVHELSQAHSAARRLENLLELCVSWASAPDERKRVRGVREAIAAELIVLGKPMSDFAGPARGPGRPRWQPPEEDRIA